MNFLKKTVFAFVAALAAQTVSAADDLFGRIAMEGVDIISSVTYLKINAYDAGEPGYYRFSYDNMYQAHTTEPLQQVMVAGGSTYHDGKIYACEYDNSFRVDLQKPRWVIYDAKTFKRLTDIEKGDNYDCTLQSITYDPTTDKIYGIKQKSAMEYCLVEIDPATGDNKQIGKVLDNRYRYKTIGCDKKGQLYIIYMESVDNDSESSDVWYLDKVRKGDGRMVRVNTISMENLLDGDYYINDTRRQSLFCNFQTGLMYWIYPSSSSYLYQEVTNIVELNTVTAVGTLKAYDTKTVLTSGAFFVEPDGKAPAIISDFAFEPNTPAGLTGKLMFTMPAKAYDGTDLSGEQTVVVKEGDKVIVDSKAMPGKEFISDDITFTNEMHKITITISNAAGEGPTVKREFFVGYDIPTECTNVKLVADGLKTILTWDAPTVGVNGSPVDKENLTYKVVRYPYEVTVAEGLKDCRFEETHPEDMTRYVYMVTPSVGQANGKGVFSNNLIVGTPLDVPYGGPFMGPEDMINYYTILDANGDKNSWKYAVEQGSAVYQFSPYVAADDWLISPPVNYKKGKTYTLTFSAHSVLEDYLEEMVVTFGNERTPEAQSQVLLDLKPVPMPPSASRDNVYNVDFTVPADGVYYYGFHCVTPAYHGNLFLHDIMVKEKKETSIKADYVDGEKAAFITNVSGQRTAGLQKGVNIVKMENGTTKKVVIE